jgi:general stress protein YciG
MTTTTDGKSRRGFASMTPERLREIASKGGKSAHLKGVAHRFTSEEAKLAGKKGGQQVAADREHMAAIGRIGGASRREK